MSNTWVTYLGHRDSGVPSNRDFAKAPVIPDDPVVSHDMTGKVQAVWDRFMSYQLVGEVTAYQGIDGYRA